MTWRGGRCVRRRRAERAERSLSEISREPSSQHATRGFVGTATFRARSGGLSGREASAGRHVLAAYLSGRLGEERGGFAEHLCRLGPHGGRFGNVRLVSSKGNKITTDARARSRFPTAFATARQLTSPERVERGARDDACDEKGRARSCVHRTTTREADVETLLFEGKKHYSRVIRWRRRAEHEMVVK
jgi:hypothetical protein